MSYAPKLHETSGGTATTVEVPTRKYRVLLVDDHPITRQGVRAVLATTPNLEVCAEADDATAALHLAATVKPDLAIVDVSLGAANGIELVRALRQQSPHVPVLVL